MASGCWSTSRTGCGTTSTSWSRSTDAVTGIDRDAIVAALHAENVLARRYFYPGCHRHAPYVSSRREWYLPVTDDVAARVVVLPTGTSMGPEDCLTVGKLLGELVDGGAPLATRIADRRHRSMSHELIPLDRRRGLGPGAGGPPAPARAHPPPRRGVPGQLTGRHALLYVHRDAHGAADVACPIAVRGAPGERDAYTPYGFGGFAAARPVPTFAAEWDSFAGRERMGRVVRLPEPTAGSGPRLPRRRVRSRRRRRYVLDLARPADDLLARMSPRRRAELRRWARRPPI